MCSPDRIPHDRYSGVLWVSCIKPSQLNWVQRAPARLKNTHKQPAKEIGTLCTQAVWKKQPRWFIPYKSATFPVIILETLERFSFPRLLKQHFKYNVSVSLVQFYFWIFLGKISFSKKGGNNAIYFVNAYLAGRILNETKYWLRYITYIKNCDILPFTFNAFFFCRRLLYLNMLL